MRPLSGRQRVPSPLFVLFVVLVVATSPARGDEPVLVGDPRVATSPSGDPAGTVPETATPPAGSGVTPVFAPIPFKNSQLGWGLTVMAGLIHRFDPDTTLKPSTGAVAGFYSENGSWGVMALEMARLSQDRWRLLGLASYMDLHYDFFGIGEAAGDAGISIPIDQTVAFAVGSALRRVTRGLYAGAAVLWIRSDAALGQAQESTEPPADDDLAQLDLVAPGLQAEFDSRDDDYWPSHGSYALARSTFFTPGLGSAREFQRYMVGWSWYGTLRPDRLVLATNANAAFAKGDAPFWAIPSVGAGIYGLRGYTQGRYRDKVVTTLQAELRGHTAGRWGATAFFGIAQVAPALDALGDSDVLPAGGAGLRFQLTDRYPMHMRADYAWGRKESILYISVGEAF
jgi:hypothetical protein